ncbi:MAG TPA: porin [Mucilaginibacter sp.]|jgi:phosphate-selective porin|nr:porin [Mucilaginibacter sp.]
MKPLYSKRILLILVLLVSAVVSKAQQNEDLLNILIKKNLITQEEADSIRSDQAVKAQAKKDKEKDNQHLISIGSKALQISGLIQERYQGFQQKGVNDAFDLHRARLIVSGNITDNWSYYTQTELGGTGVKLVDAYTSYRVADYLRFQVGQFKIPFSLESLTSDGLLEFIDRSQVVEALAGRSKDVIGNQQGRDIGAQISGSFAKLDDHYLFDYTFGVFNGAGYDVTTDNNDRKDWAGRFGVHPIKNLDLGADIYEGKGIPTGGTKDQARNRYGFDGRYILGPLSLTAEYDHGTDAAIQKDGWFAQAGYYLIPQIQVVARYDTFDPNKLIATDRTKIYSGGVNFFFNKWTKLAIDYLDRREETATQVKNNIFEAQLQLAF